MKQFRKWVGLFTMLAFAATVIPAASHAAIGHKHNTTTKVSTHDDCHHAAKETSSKTEGACCKDMCKCATGLCHGGLAKAFGDDNAQLPIFASSRNQFSFVEKHVDSAFLDRLKRPPKA